MSSYLGWYSPVECEMGLNEVDYSLQTQLYQPSRFHSDGYKVSKVSPGNLLKRELKSASSTQLHEERCYGEKIRRTEL